MKARGIVFIILALAGVYLARDYIPRADSFSTSISEGDAILKQAFNLQQSDLQVEGSGVVLKILPDDNDGSRHQRFILKLDSGMTLLIAHNIDISPRVSPLSTGDRIRFYGEYEWNDKGGVIHWTHPDPNGRHVAGWLKKE